MIYDAHNLLQVIICYNQPPGTFPKFQNLSLKCNAYYTEKLISDSSKGFGGKFGVQKDRQDKTSVGYDHQTELSKHNSQTDGAKGFGGKFGVQQGSQDKVEPPLMQSHTPPTPHNSKDYEVS